MHHPFQCLAHGNSEGKANFIFAASGSHVASLSLRDGSLAASWPTETPPTEVAASTEHDAERPTKKQKKTAQASTNVPNVIKLALAPDQQHLVAVTDDKCVRVLSVESNGKLAEISQRTMPKRPCAVVVTADSQTILSGDKFGDVYSLPLLPSSPEHKDTVAGAEGTVAVEAQPFKPSATKVTVHTKRNLQALENQQKQKNFKHKSKEPLKFEHKLLLGHVSMLTDLCFATREVESKQRDYIITSDRDEHIRVSRGPPQAHIIEGYCLGHKEFVSELCLVPGTDLLVSGGGDDWLGLWDWPTFTLRRHLDLKLAFQTSLLDDTALLNDIQIAVSGLWIVPCTASGVRGTALAIACEGVCALFTIPTSELENPDAQVTTSALPGIVLDIVTVDKSMVLSLNLRDDECRQSLQALELHIIDSSRLQQDTDLQQRLSALNEASRPIADEKKMDDLLYSVAKLRKRAGGEDQEAE